MHSQAVAVSNLTKPCSNGTLASRNIPSTVESVNFMASWPPMAQARPPKCENCHEATPYRGQYESIWHRGLSRQDSVMRFMGVLPQ